MELNKTTLNEQIIQVKFIYIYWRKIAIWYLIYDVPSLQYSPQTKKTPRNDHHINQAMSCLSRAEASQEFVCNQSLEKWSRHSF